MFDYNQLAALAAIIRVGSFDGAAAALGITQPAVSQRLRALEDRLGQPLVLRGQPCTATPAGQRLARHAEEVGLMEAQLTAALGPGPEAGPRFLRIAVNADSLASWIVPALAAAQEAVPGLLFDLAVDDQDHSADWLRRGEVSAAVTGTARPPHGCEAHPLGVMRYIASASPGWIARHCPDGVTGAVMRRAPAMTYDEKDRLQLMWLDRTFGPGRAPPQHYLPSTHAFIHGAEAGLGWGMNPEMLIGAALESGRLRPLLPDTPLDVPLYWMTPRHLSDTLRPVTRAIRATAQRMLRQPPRPDPAGPA